MLNSSVQLSTTSFEVPHEGDTVVPVKEDPKRLLLVSIKFHACGRMLTTTLCR